MNKKTCLLFLLIIFFSFLNNGVNADQEYKINEYNKFKKKWSHKYSNFALACSVYHIDLEGEQCGYGADNNQEGANQVAISWCSKKNSDCNVVIENNNWVHTRQQRQNLARENYINQCEYIGFKRNTEKMGECVLRISQAEQTIVTNSNSNRSGGNDNSLAELFILQESLKVLKTPTQQPNKNIRCNFNKVGGIGSVNCF